MSSPTKPRTWSGGKSKSWVPRACDRCRKRKARCDEAVPCKTCSDAGARCTHDAPVLKRGPRPRPQTHDLENRLRNLEHLISSIPGGSAAASSSLSSGELDQIRIAAYTTPSDSSPSERWIDAAGGQTYEGAPSTPWTTTGGYGEPSWGHGQGSGYSANPAMPPPQVSIRSPSVSGQDLLYKDAEGQTKWLGPSSGMPLLDRLKPGISSPPVPSGMSLPEEWISLSAAIGMDVERQALPRSSGLGDHQRGMVDGIGVEDEGLWPELLSICPQDMVDGLVRAYFTISHLLWPILHAPTFMQQYHSQHSRRNPSFVALVLSTCCLSSRYAQDPRLAGSDTASRLLSFAKRTVASVAAERTDLEVVQALFNMSVVQEGTARPNLLWVYLSQALSMAIDLGLHRRVDEWSSFTAVDIEVRKRTLWAMYAQNIKASCTYGRPPLLRLGDLDLDEPSAVDDVYISVETGIGVQPPDRPSVMAGFAAAVRLHMILERTIRDINRVPQDPSESTSFISLLAPYPRQPRLLDELALIPRVCEDLPGNWTYTPTAVNDPDSVRFFQRTRVFTLQHFIRLLAARHQFSEALARSSVGSPGDEVQPILQQITQSALGIVGTYYAINARERLGFFGAHAIVQLTQAGAGLIGVILHVRSASTPGKESLWNPSMQGLPAAIQVLRQLGHRRPAGLRSAELLAEFSRACQIPVFTGDSNGPAKPVDVPMLRSLPRRTRGMDMAMGTGVEQNFDDWLGMALQGSQDGWAVPTS